MYKNLKWIRLVPDQPGKGGMKTGIHSFQAQSVNDTRLVTQMHVYNGLWRKDFDTQAVSGTTDDFTTAFNASAAIHAYVYPNLTNPAAPMNVTYLGHNYGPGFNMRYWDYTAGLTRETHAATYTPGSETPIPATFLDIGGRCFAFDGWREGLIFDDRVPAIRKGGTNQAYISVKNQNLGISTPLSLPGLATTNPYSSVGLAYVHDDSPYINTPNENSPIAGVLSTDTVHVEKLNPSYPHYDAGTLMADGTPSINAECSKTVPFTATGTIAINKGSSIITLSGATWPNLWAYCGLRINFLGYSYVLWETYEGAGGSNSCYDLDGNGIFLTAGQALIMGVYDGPNITSATYTITGCRISNLSGVPSASTLATTNSNASYNGYSQSTASRLVKVGVSVTAPVGKPLGNLTFAADSPIRYAYAWYDPETGHVSNLSPLFTIPATVDLADVSEKFKVAGGDISYPNGNYIVGGLPVVQEGTDAGRFSHVLFFRTMTGGGSTFFPIGSLQPYVGKVHSGSGSTRGSWNPDWMGLPNDYVEAFAPYSSSWYDLSSDDDLLVTAGLIGPQYTNEKPMATLPGGAEEPGKPYAAGYWDERLWIACTQEPDKIMFSCDSVQCPFGVPEESFPATNFLRIPSVDGRVVGIRTIAELLLITTERWAYTVVGNNESNYRLVRVSTAMPGVGTYQISELTSDVENQPSIVYFLGRDQRVYEWVPGMNARVISGPISDQLAYFLAPPSGTGYTNLVAYQFSRVHCASAWGRRVVALSVFPWDTVALPSGNLPSTLFLFDVDNRTWTLNPIDNGNEWPMSTLAGPTAFATVYGQNPAVNEIAAVVSPGFAARLRSWLRDDSTNCTSTASVLRTPPINFDGKKTRKQLVVVNVHMNGAGAAWQVVVRVDESTDTSRNYQKALQAYPDPLYAVYGPNPAPVDYVYPTDVVNGSGLLWSDLAVFQADFGELSGATGRPPTGYRFEIEVSQTTLSGPARIFAIDIGYIDYAEEGEVDP